MKGKYINIGISGIKCDECDYKDLFGDWGQTKEEILEMNTNMIGTPCPECGANLLTEEDAATVVKMVEMVDLVESMGEEIATTNPEIKDETEKVIVRLEMNGSGSIKMKL